MSPPWSAVRVYRAASVFTRCDTWSWVPGIRASTRALSPCAPFRGGALPSVQYDTALTTFGSAASSLVSAVPSATTAGASTFPPGAVTRRMRFGAPVPKVRASAVSAL